MSKKVSSVSYRQAEYSTVMTHPSGSEEIVSWTVWGRDNNNRVWVNQTSSIATSGNNRLMCMSADSWHQLATNFDNGDFSVIAEA